MIFQLVYRVNEILQHDNLIENNTRELRSMNLTIPEKCKHDDTVICDWVKNPLVKQQIHIAHIRFIKHSLHFVDRSKITVEIDGEAAEALKQCCEIRNYALQTCFHLPNTDFEHGIGFFGFPQILYGFKVVFVNKDGVKLS